MSKAARGTLEEITMDNEEERAAYFDGILAIEYVSSDVGMKCLASAMCNCVTYADAKFKSVFGFGSDGRLREEPCRCAPQFPFADLHFNYNIIQVFCLHGRWFELPRRDVPELCFADAQA